MDIKYSLHHECRADDFPDYPSAHYIATELALDGIESRIEHLAEDYPDEVYGPLDRDKIIEYIGSEKLDAYMDEPSWKFVGYSWLVAIEMGDDDTIKEVLGEA